MIDCTALRGTMAHLTSAAFVLGMPRALLGSEAS
jgi:hypothetical protein